MGNAGEWAHDIRGLLKNSSGLATMVAKLLYQALPADRHVLIRKGDEKLGILGRTAFAHCANSTGAGAASGAGTAHEICSGLRAAAGGQAGAAGEVFPGWQYGVVDAASARSQLAFARLGQYNAAFMSSLGDAGVFKPAADMRSPWFAYLAREAPFVAIDGECYYGTPWPAKGRLLVEGHAAAARMVAHSFNTSSPWANRLAGSLGLGAYRPNNSQPQTSKTPRSQSEGLGPPPHITQCHAPPRTNGEVASEPKVLSAQVLAP